MTAELWLNGHVITGDTANEPKNCRSSVENAEQRPFALDEAERKLLQEVIDDLAAGGGRTDLAASRFKHLMRNAGVAVGSGLYKPVVEVASDAAKKVLMG